MAQAAGQCHEFGGGGPQGHFIDARMAYMSAHSQEFQTARTVLALRRPPRPTLRRIPGTMAKVSTLLINVGLPNRPCEPGKGGLLRGSARLSSSASSNAVSSPQM